MRVIPVVHAITNDEVLLRDDFLQQATDVMHALGGRGAVHLRARWLSARRMHDLAVRLVRYERETGCWIVVNDRVDVACAADAQAVQLTSRSMSVADARAVRSTLRIGASVHTLVDALSAETGGADWCIAGSAFATATHPEEQPAGVELISEIALSIRIPVIPIGGVTPEAVPQLRSAGAYGVAAITGVWYSADVGKAARDYLSKYDTRDGVS